MEEHCRKIHRKNVAAYRSKLHQDFANNVTLHGYRQLVNEKGWRRITWFIVMTGFTSFAIYLFFQTLIDYGYKTSLEYEEEDGISQLDYPTLTICRNSPVHHATTFQRLSLNATVDELKDFYLREISTVSYFYNSTMSSRRILNTLNLLNYTSYEQIIKAFENTIFDSTDVWRRLLAGAVCYLGDTPCNLTTDFRETLHWEHSLCHQWNFYDVGRGSKQQLGLNQKMTILLNIHSDKKLISYYPFYGLVLFIHPYGTPHYMTTHTDSMGLQTGIYTSVDIALTEVNFLPKPYSTDCGSKELEVIRNVPYTRSWCEIDCVLLKVYRKCQCVGFEFEGKVDADIPICRMDQMRCYFRYRDLYKDTCTTVAASCPAECTQYKYHFSRSLIMSIGDEMMQHMLYNMKDWNGSKEESQTYMRNNLLGFEIGYKRLSKQKEVYKPSVTFSAVIGTVGGSIGLCLGFSFVSGYEFLCFIYDYIVASWTLKKPLVIDQH